MIAEREEMGTRDLNELIIQDACPVCGIDLRCVVLGNEIIARVLRESADDKEFRSNVSLGGHASLYECDEDETRELDGMISRLGLDLYLAGVDFLWDGYRWVFNEIEDIVGVRSVYALSDMDTAEMYMDFIDTKVRGEKC